MVLLSSQTMTEWLTERKQGASIPLNVWTGAAHHQIPKPWTPSQTAFPEISLQPQKMQVYGQMCPVTTVPQLRPIPPSAFITDLRPGARGRPTTHSTQKGLPPSSFERRLLVCVVHRQADMKFLQHGQVNPCFKFKKKSAFRKIKEIYQ